MCVRSLPERHKNDWLVTHLILLSNISALVVTSLGQTPCRRMADVTVVFGDFLIGLEIKRKMLSSYFLKLIPIHKTRDSSS